MLKDDVVSLEVAKELQEAGIELEAYYWWRIFYKVDPETCCAILDEIQSVDLIYNEADPTKHQGGSIRYIPTYTLDQMLRELPWKIEHGECEKKHTRNCIHTCIGSFFRLEAADEKEYHAEYLCLKQYVHNRGMEVNDNPATACAKLLLWCIKNGYVK